MCFASSRQSSTESAERRLDFYAKALSDPIYKIPVGGSEIDFQDGAIGEAGGAQRVHVFFTNRCWIDGEIPSVFEHLAFGRSKTLPVLTVA